MLSGLLKHEITTISTVTRDGYGRKTNTTKYSSVKCRWHEGFNQVLDDEGQEVISKVQVWLPPTIDGTATSIVSDDIITYSGTEYSIISITNHPNILGELEYIKLYLK